MGCPAEMRKPEMKGSPGRDKSPLFHNRTPLLLIDTEILNKSWHRHCRKKGRETAMVYWIDHNGEKLGPMKAIDVLRRARGETRVYNGETWFTIADGPEAGDMPASDAVSRETR
jgi:hypothetical protein